MGYNPNPIYCSLKNVWCYDVNCWSCSLPDYIPYTFPDYNTYTVKYWYPCPKCGNTVEVGDNYCKHCGYELIPKKKVCPCCGKELEQV